MKDVDVAQAVEYIEDIGIRVHFTEKGWPMVGVFRRDLDPEIKQEKWIGDVIEPWQARELGNLLQTLGERLNRSADGVEAARGVVMARPENGGADFGGPS